MAEVRRKCAKCGRNRAERFFVSSRGRVCSTCRRASARRNSRNTRLVKTYGITQAEYEEMYEEQEGRCLICQGWRAVLHIDHDHKIEALLGLTRHSVRGLLCATCNKTLGKFRDDAERFRRAADYLERGPRWPATTPPSRRSRVTSVTR